MAERKAKPVKDRVVVREDDDGRWYGSYVSVAGIVWDRGQSRAMRLTKTRARECVKAVRDPEAKVVRLKLRPKEPDPLRLAAALVVQRYGSGPVGSRLRALCDAVGGLDAVRELAGVPRV